MATWYVLYAPAKTPKDIVERLQKEVAVILKNPDVQKRIESVGGEPGEMMPEQFAEFACVEYERYGKLIEQANIKSD